MTEHQVLALSIVKTLHRAGYIAYYAGGWVRDWVMNCPSSDVDIATDAPPNVILDLFPHTLLIGLSFGVVIVLIDGHQFEVSTFRRDGDYEDGRKPTQIELSHPQEDALRRDFTINGMFYDPLENKIYDYVHGMQDIEHHKIRTIGDPYQRFYEDRLRMIRAVRFAARFDFTIDPETEEAIRENADTLFPAVAMERIWQEFDKMAKKPRFDWALIHMHRLGLLPVIFPQLEHTPLHLIKERVAHFARFPKQTPTILYLLCLFPQFGSQEAEELYRYLKISHKDWQWMQLRLQSQQLFKEEQLGKFISNWEWVQFYAKPQSTLLLELYAVNLSDEEASHWQKRHIKRRKKLFTWIECIERKTPILTATDLLAAGFQPGKALGELLKKAEKLAADEMIDDKQTLLHLLLKTSTA